MDYKNIVTSCLESISELAHRVVYFTLLYNKYVTVLVLAIAVVNVLLVGSDGRR